MASSFVVIRPAEGRDHAMVRALTEREFARVPQGESARDAIESALAGLGDEHRAVVADEEGEVVGVAVYGAVAGAVGTAKVHAILVTAAARMRGVAAALCDHAAAELSAEGARLMIAELPDTPALRPGAALLERCGWHEEARVPDFYADGVALRLFRRQLPGPQADAARPPSGS